MNTLRVLIADDHPLFRDGLRALLEADPDIEVVGEAADGDEAVRLTETLQPDVILMDVAMPGLSGLEAIERILARDEQAKVLVLTMFDDDTVVRALRLGARGYLLKGANGEETLKAVHAVAAGGAVFSSAAAKRVAEYVRGSSGQPRTTPFPELTDREREILELMARGLTNGAIAEQLYLRPKTVRNRISEIFSKLGVADRPQAIVRAREAGMGAEQPRSSRVHSE